MLAVVLLVAAAGLLGRRVSLQEKQIALLTADMRLLETELASIETSSNPWPVTVDIAERIPLTFNDPESLAYHIIRSEVKQQDFIYSLERDIHRNPVLGYWLAETHASVDLENDPLPFRTHHDLMQAQAKSWDYEPYMAFPYQVIYPGGQN